MQVFTETIKCYKSVFDIKYFIETNNDDNEQLVTYSCVSQFQAPTSLPSQATPRVLHLLSAPISGFVPPELPGGRTYYLYYLLLAGSRK